MNFRVIQLAFKGKFSDHEWELRFGKGGPIIAVLCHVEKVNL
jgi:hypothetical protein